MNCSLSASGGGCSWAIQDDIVTAQKIVKHGDGGEAMLRIDTFTLVSESPPPGLTMEQRIAWRDTAIVRRMSTWFDEVHAYEDRCQPRHDGEQG